MGIPADDDDTTIVGPSRAVKLCGTETTDPPRRRLAAGRLTAELENGQLRYVSFGGIETLRGIAFLVRDENWGTYAPQINELEVEESAESFVVSYRAVCADPRQRLVYEARISWIEQRLSHLRGRRHAGDRLHHQPRGLRCPASRRTCRAKSSKFPTSMAVS